MKFRTSLEPSNSLIDLTPLVDVVLLMLVFFIITSDILPLKSLNVENPTIDRIAPPRTSQILVVMDAQNVIYVGSKKEIVDLDSFKESLSHEIQKHLADADTTVVLRIDRTRFRTCHVAGLNLQRGIGYQVQLPIPVRIRYCAL